MKILFLILLSLEEAIVSLSSSGPVSLLEIRWAKKMALMEKTAGLKEASQEVVLSRVALQRYSGNFSIKEEEVKPYLFKAREIGLPDEFSVPFIRGFLILRKIYKKKFNSREGPYLLWRKNELKRQNFRFILKIKKSS